MSKKIEGRSGREAVNSSVVRPQLLSHLNEVAVLNAVQREGELTRSELCKIAGVTFPTAAKAVLSLIKLGLLEEVDRDSPGPGRPAKCVRIAANRSTVLGISIGLTECEIVASGFDGSFRQETNFTFPPPASYEELLETICEYVGSMPDGSTDRMLRAAVTIAGLVDYSESQVRVAASQPWLNGRSVADDLTKLLGIECVMVRDVHALCLAEYLYGHASDYNTYCVLDGSSGLGVGIMSNGNLFIGANGYTGEIGHGPNVAGNRPCTCGKKGCLETVASEWGLLSTASENTGRHLLFEQLVQLANQGDTAVMDAIKLQTDYLAAGLSQIYSLFNPQSIYLNGRMFHRIPGLFDQLVEKTREQTLSVIFDAGSLQLASRTVLQGAVASAIASITASPVDSLRASLHGGNAVSAFPRQVGVRHRPVANRTLTEEN